jgi:hypothetical protein
MHCPQIGYTWKPRWKLWVLFQDVILTGIGILLTSYFWMQRIHVGTSVETCWNHGIQCKFHYTSAAIWMLNSFKKSTIIELSIHWWLMNHSWYFAESTCSKLNTHIDIENKKGFPFSMISFLPFLRIYISQLAGLLLVYVCIYIYILFPVSSHLNESQYFIGLKTVRIFWDSYPDLMNSLTLYMVGYPDFFQPSLAITTPSQVQWSFWMRFTLRDNRSLRCPWRRRKASWKRWLRRSPGRSRSGAQPKEEHMCVYNNNIC